MGLPKHLQDATQQEISNYYRELQKKLPKERGFALMDKERVKEIAKMPHRRGGKSEKKKDDAPSES